MTKVANIDELQYKKISSLIWQYALPAIVGTSVNALYNIIDGIYIGNSELGKAGIGAIGIALPVMIIITAVGMLVGAGGASRISISVGQGDRERAEKILGNAFLLSIFITIPASILLIVFIDPILSISGIKGLTFDYAKEFLIYLLPGSIFSTMCFGFNNMMRASGYPSKAMYTMLISVVCNIAIAPIFIFVFHWGMKGAALATVLSMFIGLCFVMSHFLSGSSFIRLYRKNLKWDKEIVKSIVSIGMSPFCIQLTGALVAFLIYNRLASFGGETAVEAYTIANRTIMIVLMIIVGLTQGMQPIVGYNYGAKRYERVREALVYTIKVGIAIGTVGLIIGQLIPSIVILPFNPPPELAAEASKGLSILTIMLPVVGFQIVVTNFFQSIGKAGISILLSLSRQFIILIPALIILPPIFGLNGVWASLPTSDFIATVLTAILFIWQIRQFKKLEIENQTTL